MCVCVCVETFSYFRFVSQDLREEVCQCHQLHIVMATVVVYGAQDSLHCEGLGHIYTTHKHTYTLTASSHEPITTRMEHKAVI